MKNNSRRIFFRHVTLGISALVFNSILTACEQAKIPTPSIPATSTLFKSTEIPLQTTPTSGDQSIEKSPIDPTSTMQQPTATVVPTPEYPYLVVARGGEPEALVQRAISAIGGIERFVSKGANVIIKPNICTSYYPYEYAATTNPWVVSALVKLCIGAGAKSVKVMDFPFGGTAEEAYARSGIEKEVKAAGGEMPIMSALKYVPTTLPDAVVYKKSNIYDDILKADVLINVPIAKHHNLSRLTLGMKNLMGVVKDRPVLHSNLAPNLADLAAFIKPALTVIDAIRILRNNGPTGGNLEDVKKIDTIIMSPDIVAADAYGSTLFGYKPDDLNYVKAGAKIGLGRMDLENLKIEEINVGA
jgi:uncharacterized protein (DUF362 family)